MEPEELEAGWMILCNLMISHSGLGSRSWLFVGGPARPWPQHSDPASGDLAGHAEPGFHLLPARVPVTAREPGPSRLSARHRDRDWLSIRHRTVTVMSKAGSLNPLRSSTE